MQQCEALQFFNKMEAFKIAFSLIQFSKEWNIQRQQLLTTSLMA